MNIDINDLDFNNAGNWPLPIKMIAILALCAGVGFAGYWFDTKEQLVVLDNSKAKEEELKKEFETKQSVAANLIPYRRQMKEMEKTFGALLLQLPSKTEVAELLVDVSREGLKAGLEFELFKPGDTMEIKYSITALKPDKSVTYVSNAVFTANTYPAGKPLEVIAEEPIEINVSHIRKKIVKGKDIWGIIIAATQ